MSEPVVRSYTDTFVEINDDYAFAEHIIRLDAIMHVRSSHLNVYIYTNTVGAMISFKFDRKETMAIFLKDIQAAISQTATINAFAKIEQDMKTLSEKFDELAQEEVQEELVEEDSDEEEVKEEPKFPVAKTTKECEMLLFFMMTLILTYCFSYTFFHQLAHR
jgi:hypothetical protein